MKTKIKRHSRSVLSVVLAVCMLVSCVTVSLIMTDAAQTSQQSATGAAADEAVAAAIDSQPAQEEGAALDTDESDDVSAANSSAVGAKADSESVGAANDYCVKGSFNGWNPNNTFDATTGKVSITLEANKKYEFKIFNIAVNKWYGATKDYIATDNEYNFNTSVDRNATITTTIAGDYVFELKSQDDNGVVRIGVTYPTPKPKTYTITPAAATNGTFTVSTTVATAGTIITVTAKPNRGYKLKSITATDATVSVSDNTGTFTMPSKNTTVSVEFEAATEYTITAQVTAGSGTVTLKLSTGDTTHAAVTTTGSTQASIIAYSGETLTITATPASGYQLDTLTRGGNTVSSGDPWTVSGATDVEATFTVKTTQPNEYNATAGDTISGKSNLYSKIKATFFDYYTDSEITNGWYTGIDATSDAWVGHDNTMSNINRNPYTNLNTALSQYATDNSVEHPIYFGSFYWDDVYHDPGYYRSAQTTYNGHKINDSNQLTNGNTAALPGLAGKTISDGNIYYYGTGTNENGAVMPLFDKEWLASRGENTEDPNTITLEYSDTYNWSVNGAGSSAPSVYAVFRVAWASDEYFVKMTNHPDTKTYTCTIPTGYNDKTATMIFARYESNKDKPTEGFHASYDWPTSNDEASVTYSKTSHTYTLTGWKSAQLKELPYSGPLASIVNAPFPVRKTAKNDITYYEFDSTGATDNVYFDNLTGGNPVIQYGAETTCGQKNGYNSGYGFFPFDKSTDQKISGQEWTKEYGKDLAFGMKLEIKFTVGAGGKINNVAQTFDFSGDDDLWVYIDDKLVLDLGGDHKQATGTIDFSTRNVTVTKQDTTLSSTRNQSFASWFNNNDISTVHTMTLYYMERGMHESNLKFGFSFNPLDDAYDVQKVADVDTHSLNPALTSQYSDTFTFTNTASDGKGGTASYTVYDSTSNASVGTGTTTEGRAFEMVAGRYAQFKNIFTINKNLSTTETTSGVYQYDTSYRVVDVQNNNSVIKAGIGDNTGNFNFFTNLENADPDLNITHLRTIFTNTLKTQSFMVTKEIDGFDDVDTAFPFIVTIKMSKNNYEFNVSNLQYKTSLDDYATVHTLFPCDINKAGLGYIHEGEHILFEGIPQGAKVMVQEPTYGDKYTPKADGNANCYKNVTINSENSSNAPQYTDRDGNHSDVTIQLKGFDTITITNELKNYRMDYQLPTRLYGEKIYKLTGYITPVMVAQGYVQIDNEHHTAYLTRKFVSDHIPRESIFMKDVIWRSAETDFKRSMTGFDDYVYLLATSSPQTLTVQVDRDGNGEYDTTVSGLTCGQPIKDANGEYITGTKVGETPIYWEIFSTDTNQFVTKCYSAELNYVAYDNYSIKAVYGQGTGYDYYDKQVTATVNDLGITRSHWNDTTSGVNDDNHYNEIEGHETVVRKTYNYYKADTEYDRLYLDIELAFESHGKMINTYDDSVVKVGYEICILNDNGTVNKVYKDVVLNNTSLNNKNRIHAYYGFKNTEVNRGQNLGIRAYIITEGTTTYSVIMPFELNTEGSKGLSSEYDDTPVAP